MLRVEPIGQFAKYEFNPKVSLNTQNSGVQYGSGNASLRMETSITHLLSNRFKNYFSSILGHDIFICWITSHFQEFQSVAIEKRKIELEPKI